MVRILTGATYYSGANHILRMGEPRFGGGGRGFPFAVLLYHRVNPENNPFFAATPLRVFEAHMRYLAENFNVLSVRQILSRIQNGREIKPRTIAITFDDGYRDNYIFAHPVLRKFNLAATLFAATGYMGSGRMLWNDRVSWAFQKTRKVKLSLPVGSEEKLLVIDSQEQRLSALGLVLGQLKGMKERDKNALVDRLIGDLDCECPSRSNSMLSWDELRKMSEDGWDIESHTVNHVILSKVDDDEALTEIVDSKRALERELQKGVDLFAYPNGKGCDIGALSQQQLRSAGYLAGFTTLSGFNTRDTDVFQFRRKSPWEEYLPQFACNLELAFSQANRSSTYQSRADRESR